MTKTETDTKNSICSPPLRQRIISSHFLITVTIIIIHVFFRYSVLLGQIGMRYGVISMPRTNINHTTLGGIQVVVDTGYLPDIRHVLGAEWSHAVDSDLTEHVLAAGSVLWLLSVYLEGAGGTKLVQMGAISSSGFTCKYHRSVLVLFVFGWHRTKMASIWQLHMEHSKKNGGV